jgi:DNA replication protein DnaC
MDDVKKALEHMLSESEEGLPVRERVPALYQVEADMSMERGSLEEVCSDCLGRGVIVGADDVAVRCPCMDVQQLNNRFRSARLSQELRKCRLEDFKFSYYEGKGNSGSSGSSGSSGNSGKSQSDDHLVSARKALQAAKDFVAGVLENPHCTGLVYTGQAGAGKTYLAASIANELVSRNKNVLFVVVPDLLDEMRATYDRKDVSEYDLLDSAKTIPVLILDDLGAHNYTDWTRNRIYSILNYRVNENLPTVVTTNLHHAEIAQHLGERTASRLFQMCRMFKLSVPQDIRRQQYYLREKGEKAR